MKFNLLPWLPISLLSLLLFLAVWSDVKTRLIPNNVVFAGALIGISLHIFIPTGAGLFNTPFGGLGMFTSIAGLGVGLLLLLPMYAIGAMGAGDVKLLAMVGAFLGPQAIIKVALLSMVAGGLLALIVAIYKGMLAQVLTNIHHLFIQSLMRTLAGGGVRIEAPAVPTVKLAYAIAIAIGTISYIYTSSYRFWSFI